MTLLEMVISLALLSILTLLTLFSSTSILTFVRNRIVGLPNYNIGLTKAYSVAYVDARDIQSSATFTISENVPSVTLYKKNGANLVSDTVNFKELIGIDKLSTATDATVTLQQSPNDKNLLHLYINIPSEDGRKFDNTVVIKRLVNAVPVPEKFTVNGGNVTIDLYYPALGFGIKPEGSVENSDMQLATETSTVTAVIDSNGVRKTATVTLTDITAINDIDVYQKLYIQSTATQVDYVTIPSLIGVDSTPCESITVKVETAP